MNESEPKIEQHEKPILEMWVIEDDDTVRESILGLLRFKAPGSRCVGFEKAEDALRELEQKVTKGKPTPAGIFVDGNLSKDAPGFNQGPLVVAKIRKAQQNSEPSFIVAISCEEDLNKAMIQNGANLIVAKPPNIVLLNNAIEKIKEARPVE